MAAAPDDSDAALVRAALGGRQAAYSALLARHREALFRLARHHLGNEADALDVVQESFIAAFAALGRYDPARPLRGWLLRIALNKCHDLARRRAVRRLFTFAKPLDDALDVADLGPDPEQALGSARAMAAIGAAVAELPVQLKEPLILCAIEGLSQDEAAEVLGISRKAVETRIYRARQKLADLPQIVAGT
jgi:RNA polymerase sigma-70 factor (ECF subfamily)